MDSVTKWVDVPAFANVEEEAQYWQKHQLHVSLMKEAQYKLGATESTTITLRIDPRMLARVKRIAAQRYLNYQSMIKQWLAERLEKELERR